MTLYRFPKQTLLSHHRRRHTARRAERAQRLRNDLPLVLIPVPFLVDDEVPNLSLLLAHEAPHSALLHVPVYEPAAADDGFDLIPEAA